MTAPKSKEPDCSGAKTRAGKVARIMTSQLRNPNQPQLISPAPNLCFILPFLLRQISKGSCPSSGLLSRAPNGCSNFRMTRVSYVLSVFIHCVLLCTTSAAVSSVSSRGPTKVKTEAKPSITSLHINLSLEKWWRSCPEAFWDPVFTYLKTQGVLPSEQHLKELTPSANW